MNRWTAHNRCPIKPACVPERVWAIPLSGGLVAIVDESDFSLIADRLWHSAHGYAADSQQQYMHRFIMGAGPDDPGVDHINGNGLDNRRSNLRWADQPLNLANQRLSRANTSGYRGVYWDARGKTWRAAIKVNRKVRSLGTHKTRESAARAYDAAARETWGDFARLNFPEQGENGV